MDAFFVKQFETIHIIKWLFEYMRVCVGVTVLLVLSEMLLFIQYVFSHCIFFLVVLCDSDILEIHWATELVIMTFKYNSTWPHSNKISYLTQGSS